MRDLVQRLTVSQTNTIFTLIIANGHFREVLGDNTVVYILPREVAQKKIAFSLCSGYDTVGKSIFYNNV